MSTSTELRGTVRAALAALIDYAGLFPPAKLAMREAIAEYDAARRGPHAWMLGRFIVPASRLPEFLEAAKGLEPFRLSVIVDADLEPRGWFAAARGAIADIAAWAEIAGVHRIDVLEAPLPAPLSLREGYEATIGQLAGLVAHAGLRHAALFVEWPRNARWNELLPGAMSAASRARVGAKVRCGGLSAEAYPSIGELAAFIDAAATEHVPFKATAGLHHPLRHRNEAAGVEMHGFLNLLVAAIFAHRVPRETVQAILAEEDARAFVFDDAGVIWQNDRATAAEIELARVDDFVAYGSCSFAEPVDDLTALSILPRV